MFRFVSKDTDALPRHRSKPAYRAFPSVVDLAWSMQDEVLGGITDH